MRARKEIYDKDKVGVYHCYSRCVRRAFLCGNDPYTGKNYDHRKQWMDRLVERAAEAHLIDVISYSVLDNHFHIVLRNRPDRVKKLSASCIAWRWLMLHPERKDANGEPLEPTFNEMKEITDDKDRVKELRGRLADISWFMAFVKEKVARRSNAEDEVTGAFFEKRFDMKRLLTPNAVLACALYVDLNPIYAGLAISPETAQHTSAYLRIQGTLARKSGQISRAAMKDAWLAPIHDRAIPRNQQFAAKRWRATDDPGLGMPLASYLKLLDHVGKQGRSGKPGRIPKDLLPILDRLGLSPQIEELVRDFQRLFQRVAGNADEVTRLARSKGRRWFQGISHCREHFRTPTT